MTKVRLTWAKNKKRLDRNKDLKKSLSKLKIDTIGQLEKLNGNTGKSFYKESPSLQKWL